MYMIVMEMGSRLLSAGILASVQLDVYDRHGDGVAAVVCWDSVDKDFLVNARMGWGPRGFHSRLAID